MFLFYSTLVYFCGLLTLVAPARSQADPGSGGDSAPCPTKSRYLDQVIDHSLHYSNHIFKHQYRINTTFFKEGGPVLLYQSPESTTMACPDELILTEWAQELGGMTAVLEHRYFGQSLPFGNNSFTAKNLRYFTLENVMADAVSFVNFVKTNVTGAAHSKVIVVGGSYGGFLSAPFRQNHPDTFFGAWSVAGLFRAWGDADEVGADGYNWFDYVENIYARRSFDTFTAMKAAFAQVSSWLDTGNSDMLQKSLSLCAAPSNASADRDAFIIWYTSAYSQLAQRNHLPSSFYNVSGPTLDTVIHDTLAASSPVAALNETLWHAYGMVAQNGCLDYTVSIADSIGLETVNPASIFGQGLTSGTINASRNCAQVFNTSQTTGAEVRSRFKLSREDIANSTRILFSEGEYDPVTAVAVPQTWLGDGVGIDMQKSVVVMINGIGHGQDVRPTELDPPSVVEARNVELNIIKGWLNSNVSDAP
ncbi:peptidase S28 [Lentinus brumalis]|uniref:Peptidase S28 n=1 Tax=Lentinus brumalis TaxID=2498619 RepID=A0A371CMD3_9APHY|nr:peptidase S28 [Polyporus brumalis]